jgi:tRNA (Thr-GGU) A37 N-methylase
MKLTELSQNPVGFVTQSSFKQKWGTPRQGALVPTATAIVTLCSQESTHSLIEGRVAVLWYAHLNSSSFNHLKAHIKPPKKIDGPVGVFATRGVHRPSSIGLTFCDLFRVDGNTLHLRGADMIEGTPILGLVNWESLNVPPDLAVKFPEWTIVKETKINWSLASFMSVHVLNNGDPPIELLGLARKILSQDPRSLHSMRKHINPIYEVELTRSSGKSWWMVYRHSHVGEIDVLFLSETRFVDCYRSRTELWLERLKEKVPSLRDQI